MANEVHEFTTLEAALKFARNVKNTRYMVHVHATLPTTENRYFPGSCALTISKKDFLQCVERVWSTVYAEKGARLRLEIMPNEFGLKQYLILA